MNEELQDKVSFAMVQSMIGQAAEQGLVKPSQSAAAGADAFDTFKKTRMSNVRSTDQLNRAPQIEAEESLDKYTEDFGGYSLNDGINASGGPSGLGYERPIDVSGLSRSALKQRAA